MTIDAESPGVPRWLVVAAECAFFAVIAAGVIVGVYAIANPNGINFGAPWPVGSEMIAAGAAIILGLGIRTRRRADQAMLGVGIAVALIALVLLALVAFVLSFNST